MQEVYYPPGFGAVLIGRTNNRQCPFILAFWLGLSSRRCPSYLSMVLSCLHPKVAHGFLLGSLFGTAPKSLPVNLPCIPPFDDHSLGVGGRFHYCTCREGLSPS